MVPEGSPSHGSTPFGDTPAAKANAAIRANDDAQPPDRTPVWALGVKAIGGLLAVCVGVIALAVIASVAFANGGGSEAAIVTGCVTAIGSVVGAYFGVKVGTEGTNTAIAAHAKQATHAQIASLYVSPKDADTVASQLTDGP